MEEINQDFPSQTRVQHKGKVLRTMVRCFYHFSATKKAEHSNVCALLFVSVLNSVYSQKKKVSRLRPTITKETTTSFFMQPVPTLLLLLWQPVFSPWVLHVSNQSETFVEIPPGSTYSTYPTGAASTLKELEQREERLPQQNRVWNQNCAAPGSSNRDSTVKWSWEGDT